MSFDISLSQNILNIKLGNSQVEGDQEVLNNLLENNYTEEKINKIIFDFDKVEYINSLGIAEFIAIMKYFSQEKRKIKYKFINVDKKIGKIFKMVELGNLADIETK